MKVKELLQHLQDADPEADVTVWRWHGDGHSLEYLNFGGDQIEDGVVHLTTGPEVYGHERPIKSYFVKHREDGDLDEITLSAYAAHYYKQAINRYSEDFVFLTAHNALDIYDNGDNDQPMTCPKDGTRTDWDDRFSPDGTQIHICPKCEYKFLLEVPNENS